jgi:hypothetical protein
VAFPSVASMLSVYQAMEKQGVSPNAESFSILFEVMAETGDVKGFGEIESHMKSLGKPLSWNHFLQLKRNQRIVITM